MTQPHSIRLMAALLVAAPWVLAQETAARSAAGQLSRAGKEEFLRTAKIVQTRGAKKGITGTLRATLTDGRITHDASIQTIDEAKNQFTTDRGTEFNFKDTYKFNIAAYRLDKLLGLNMTPPSVERHYDGKKAAFTWWIDDVTMDEGERMKKKTQAPDAEEWNRQMHIVRVFDQLIFNTDRNLQNLLIDKYWRIWMIDHSRAFRMHKTVREPKNLVKCDRELMDRMKALDFDAVKREMGAWLNDAEIRGLLGRRDAIVRKFQNEGDQGMYTSARRPD